MGILTYLTDAFSGKIYRQNTLIGDNIKRLLKNLEAKSGFIKTWSYFCIVSVDALLSSLLFTDLKTGDSDGKKFDFNPFNKISGKLNGHKTYEIVKLIVAHFLAVFLKNEDNSNFLKTLKITRKKFEGEIFTIFEFTRNNEINYKEMDKKFDSNTAGYYLGLYDKIFTIGFKTQSDHNLPNSLVFSKLLSNSYINFMNELQNNLE